MAMFWLSIALSLLGFAAIMFAIRPDDAQLLGEFPESDPRYLDIATWLTAGSGSAPPSRNWSRRSAIGQGPRKMPDGKGRIFMKSSPHPFDNLVHQEPYDWRCQ
jgi:hypothetical protein